MIMAHQCRRHDAYDRMGNVTQRSVKRSDGSAVVSIKQSYDALGRMVRETLGAGRPRVLTYDKEGNVTAVTDPRNLTSNMTYQPFGSVETMTLGNGLISANDRGLEGWLRGRSLTNSSSAASPAGTKLSDIAYGYDPDGNMTSMEDKVVPARSSLYGYDAGGRVNMMVAEGSNAPANYSYAPGTNRLASLTTSAAGSAAATRTVQYDARGNPSGETRSNGSGGNQAVTIAYDGHGRMTGYARQGEVSLTHSYNGNDDRISTTTTSAATATPDARRFVYAPDGRVLGEYGSSASDVKAEFIWMSPQVGDAGSFGGDDGLGGYMPLAVAANDNGTPGTTQLIWVHANHMGVPAVYTNASGAVIAPPAGYSAPGFPGQSRTLADLYYNRYRDYDPITGRYIQADPIGLAGGASPYSYAMNNPLRYTDPTGEFVPIVAGIIIGAGLELGIQAGMNWWEGRGLFDCIEWGEVAVAGGLGAFGGSWVKNWVRLSKGSMKWENASRRIRRAEGLVGKPIDLHHWLVPQKWYKGNTLGEKLFNKPWNLNKVRKPTHKDLHKLPYLVQVPLGAPGSVQGAGALGAAGAVGEMADGGWE